MTFFYFLHQEINIPLLQYLNNFTESEIIAFIVYNMADLPIFILPIFLVWYWIYRRKNNEEKKKLLFIFYSTFVAIVISICIQQFVDLDRPETSLETTGKLILDHIPDNSFPSDHASVGIAFVSSLFFFWFTKLAIGVLPFFIIMLISRVVGWVHWPFDIIAGTFVWILSAFLVYKWQNLNIFKKINNFILDIARYFKL